VIKKPVASKKAAPVKKVQDSDDDSDSNSDDKEEEKKCGDSGSVELFVGNLPFTTTEEALNDLFGQYGSVTNISLP
jgi:RNA recognition motif-containing protein